MEGALQLKDEFAKHYAKGIIPQLVEEQLIQALHDLPANSDLPVISKLIINDANRKWKKEQHRVIYEKYIEYEKAYIRKNKIKREISAVFNQELEEIQALCKQHGAMGNYSTAFSVVIKKKEENIISLAESVASKVLNICQHPQKEMLALTCYMHMQPELTDAVATAALGDFESKAGAFIGKNLFSHYGQ